jgi:hypothetical protein
MNYPGVLRSQHQPRVVADKGLVLTNKMASVNSSLKFYQYCTAHEESLFQDTKRTKNLVFWKSTASAALELINGGDNFDKFPKIEWCDDDDGVEEDECSSCSITVTKKRDPVKKLRGSSSKEKTNEIVASHYHGLVRSMRIRSRLALFSGPRNDYKPAASTVIRAARRHYKRRDLAAAHGEQHSGRHRRHDTTLNRRIVKHVVFVA